MFDWVPRVFGVVRNERELSDQTIRVSHLFTWFLFAQLVMGVVIAVYVSGQPDLNHNYFHRHILEVSLIGLGATVPGIVLSRIAPASFWTKHIVANIAMLQSLFLIVATGGRIEGHFSVFTVMAIIAFYLDWRIFITACVIGTAYHCVLGHMNPMWVYGAPHATMWRCVEHGLWIVYEVIFLIAWVAIRLSSIKTIGNLSKKLADEIKSHATEAMGVSKEMVGLASKQIKDNADLNRLHALELRHALAERKLEQLLQRELD